ncbi:hypothetical protein NP493_372g05002 [Ridgeia piscesae]|uniref:Uncharacterized protein n=1 Tax=Ridgeia piscesae TaxID=27915 RepID=A0AAD9L3M6_RIDPI|nr:hypothetical protein NP493_372g05002 [Ridgeia piscesae]
MRMSMITCPQERTILQLLQVPQHIEHMGCYVT